MSQHIESIWGLWGRGRRVSFEVPLTCWETISKRWWKSPPPLLTSALHSVTWAPTCDTLRSRLCKTLPYVRTSQVLKCLPGFSPRQPGSLGWSVHCKLSDVCGGWWSWWRLFVALLPSHRCTVYISFCSQPRWFWWKSFFSFLGYICFDFYKKTSLWASLKYHSTFTPWVQECLPSL